MGIFQDEIPEAVLAQENEYVTVPHELGHSYKLRFLDPTIPSGNEHDLTGNLANGFWPEKLNSGLRLNRTSIMAPGVHDLPESIGHWINSDAYSQLKTAMAAGEQKIKVQEINGDQLYLTGFVNLDKKFVVMGARHGLVAGATEGESDLSIRFNSKDVNGTTISDTFTPISHSMEIQSPEEGGVGEVETDLAPVSTGIPFMNNAFSIDASVVDSSRAAVSGNVTTFFPSIEIARGALERVPLDEYVGSPEAAHKELSDILDEIELLLKKGRIKEAKGKFEGQFKAQVLLLLRDSYEKQSLIDVDRNDFFATIDASVSNLSSVLGESEVFENGLFKVVPNKIRLNQGEKAQFSASAIIKLTDPDSRFFLEGNVSGNANKVSLDGSGKKWFMSTPVLSPGIYEASFRLFKENVRQSDSMRASIRVFEKRIFDLQRKLEEETDPEEISRIQSEIDSLNDEIRSLKVELERRRVQLGASISVSLTVQ